VFSSILLTFADTVSALAAILNIWRPSWKNFKVDSSVSLWCFLKTFFTKIKHRAYTLLLEIRFGGFLHGTDVNIDKY
jgi:hypothetical protein